MDVHSEITSELVVDPGGVRHPERPYHIHRLAKLDQKVFQRVARVDWAIGEEGHLVVVCHAFQRHSADEPLQVLLCVYAWLCALLGGPVVLDVTIVTLRVEGNHICLYH